MNNCLRKSVVASLFIMLFAGLSACAVLAPSSDCHRPGFAAAFYALYSEPRTADWSSLETLKQRLVNEPLQRCALQQQRELVKLYSGRSPVKGYKVALGGQNVQQAFGLRQPVVGYLFEDTFVPTSSVIDLAAGHNLAYEPDLVAIVGDKKINQAKTLADVAASLSHIAAFIEVPDLTVLPAPENGPAFIATNAAVRFGVVGEQVPALASNEFIAALASMRVTTSTSLDDQQQESKGAQLMGHPYQAVLFLLEQLRERGEELEPGDHLSLGAFAPPRVVTGPLEVSVTYEGLPGGVISAQVRFQ